MIERRGKIYKISNDINSKVYIGQTVQDVKKRFCNHCGKDNHNENMAIKRAIQKYGKEHFKIEIIEDDILKENLNEREMYWIAFYKSNDSEFGYNLTRGGDCTVVEPKFDEDQQLKICNDYKSGTTIKDLASKYNTDKCTIYRYIKQNNVNVDRQKNKNLESRVDVNEFILYIRFNYPHINDVCDKFNICRCSVYNMIKELKEYNLKLNPYNPRKSNAKIHEKEICKMYKEGYNIKDLMKIFKTDKPYVSKVLKENGITIQRNKLSYKEYNTSTSVQTQTDNAEG